MSDNGKQFDNPKFRDFYTELGIKNNSSTFQWECRSHYKDSQGSAED